MVFFKDCTCFPELKWIKNKDLRDGVIKVWKKASDQGKWDRLDDVPFTLLFEGSGLLTDHTKQMPGLMALCVESFREQYIHMPIQLRLKDKATLFVEL